MSKRKNPPQVRGREDHSPEGSPDPAASPCVAGEKKFARAHPAFFLLLWSPPLSTRVIDGWGSFWPRLVHFALQRVPPSPSQTMRTRIGLITNQHSCECSGLFIYFVHLLLYLSAPTFFFFFFEMHLFANWSIVMRNHYFISISNVFAFLPILFTNQKHLSGTLLLS